MSTTTDSIVRRLFEGEQLMRRGPGEVIFRESEAARGVYVVHSGEIDLVFHERDGQRRLLHVDDPGRILGLSAVVSGKPHDCSATTLTPCVIGFLERHAFISALDSSPTVRFRVLELLSHDVNSSYRRMRAVKECRAVW
jgi:CRP/FNR family transcriptional regulator